MGTHPLASTAPAAHAPVEFAVRLAGLDVAVAALHEETRAFCREYLTSTTDANHAVRLSQEHVDHERAVSACDDRAAGRAVRTFPDSYLETLALLRMVAEWLPLHDRLLFHGAVVEFAGHAYLFTAPSGTGKSTHARLWRAHLGNAVRIINGDKPFIAVPAGGVPVAYGTPWAGKEGWQCNTSAPLAAICFLERGSNAIQEVAPLEVLESALQQVYRPACASAAGRTLELLDRLLASVPLYRLACDVSEEAVRCSFEALTGLRYEEHCANGGVQGLAHDVGDN